MLADMNNDQDKCVYCGSSLSPKSNEICGAVSCLLKRNAAVAKAYQEKNREHINEQRRQRYRMKLTTTQGRTMQALWQEGFFYQKGSQVISPQTGLQICNEGVIRALTKRGLVFLTDERWMPAVKRDEFEAQGYTFCNDSKPNKSSK